VIALYTLINKPGTTPENSTTSMKVTERHIYGSSRLGMDVQSIELIDQEGPLLDTSQFRILGLKQYEISNHLGNVLSVISDVKLAVTFTDQNNLVSIVGYKAVVISATDYSPFGVGLYERSWSSPEYSYGFQGQEQDHEFLEGAFNYKYRVEDSRLGRFFSVDPLHHKYAWNSQYAFSENQVIHGIELEGCEVTYEKHIETKEGVETTIIQITVFVTVSKVDTKMNNQLPSPAEIETANAGFKATETAFNRQIDDVIYKINVVQVDENEIRAPGQRVNLVFDSRLPINVLNGYTEKTYDHMNNQGEGEVQIPPLLRRITAIMAIAHELGHFLGLRHIPRIFSNLNLMVRKTQLKYPDKDENATGQEVISKNVSDRQVKKVFRKVARESERNKRRISKEFEKNKSKS
jgi:RHS repeat-associated protein